MHIQGIKDKFSSFLETNLSYKIESSFTTLAIPERK